MHKYNIQTIDTNFYLLHNINILVIKISKIIIFIYLFYAKKKKKSLHVTVKHNIIRN